ncbi:hypothetical protein ACFLIM_05690 [Nonomuraea sp. M3C6]|uniref:Uncharacterized protein n=1 Tax=Nonomuraea marmarensis TaxID=3351344 RepID=A0ABW7A8S8_9ACTN
MVRPNRIVCLLCGLPEGRLLNRASFFQLHEARKGWARGLPIHAAAHEDLLIFVKPPRAVMSSLAFAQATGGLNQ